MNKGKKIVMMAGVFILVLSSFPAISSDGAHFSDVYYHLYEPYQKAVIYWNGTVETMILASAGQAENLTNMAWVIPIISTTQPKVTEGNISVFEDLVDYFGRAPYPIYNDLHWFTKLSYGTSNVTVLEVKEVAIYDIIILKATNASDLIFWLLENDFLVSEETSLVLDKYVSNDNCYFIVNKIDLTNKYSSVSNLIENGSITIDLNRKYESESWLRNEWYFEKFLKIQTLQILLNKEMIDHNFWYLKYWNHNYLFDVGFSQTQYQYLVDHFSVDKKNPLHLISTDSLIYDDINEIIQDNETMQKYSAIYEALSDHFNPIYEYKEMIDKIKKGIATPLQFEFTPIDPYYPLVISSLNSGYGMIEVYVVAEHPIIDMNNVMKLDACKFITQELKEKLAHNFSTEKAEYVSRLTYQGFLNDLTDDAVFTIFPLISPENPISIHKKDDFHILISEHHIWGINLERNGDIIEVQYQIDNEGSWTVINGTKLWALNIDDLLLDNGEHHLELRLLYMNGMNPTYSNTSSVSFNMLHGTIVGDAEMRDYYHMFTVLFITGLVALSLCVIALIMRKMMFNTAK
jgi:uncharacterized protein DUF2330